MFKKILNKKKEETDSSSDSEDETVPHVGRKEKKSSVASLKDKLVGGGPTKKESKSSPVVTQSVRARAGSLSEEEYDEYGEKKKKRANQSGSHLQTSWQPNSYGGTRHCGAGDSSAWSARPILLFV